MTAKLEFANPPPQLLFKIVEELDWIEIPLKNAGTGHIHITNVTHTGAHDAVVFSWGTEAFPNAHSQFGLLTAKRGSMPGGEIEFVVDSSANKLVAKLSVAATTRSPGGAGCFSGDALVLLADGTTRPIANVTAGDRIATVAELAHLRGRPERSVAEVQQVHRHDGDFALVDVAGIGVTADHRWAMHDGIEPGFAPTERLTASHRLLAIAGLVDMVERRPRASAQTVWNLTTSAQTYCVAASQAGPFFVVHNTKKRTGPVKEPGTPKV